MKQYLYVLKKCPLFKNLSDDEIVRAIDLVDAKIKFYEKDSVILNVKDYTEEIGIVLSGEVNIERLSFDGNKSIVSKIGESKIFAEAFVLAKYEQIPISVVCAKECEILFINYNTFQNLSKLDYEIYKAISSNLLNNMANKLIFLNRKVEILEKKTTREKILAYLEPFFKKYGKKTFEIPFNREELANYLSVNRSALSRELSNMKKDKIIDYNKNCFKKVN